MFTVTKIRALYQVIIAAFFTIIIFVSSATAQTPFRIELGDLDSIARGSNISIPVYKTAGSEEMRGLIF